MKTFVNDPANFHQTVNSITIRGSQTPLSNGYNLDSFSLNQTIPFGGFTVRDNFGLVEDMEIFNLSSGTAYSVLLDGYVGSNCYVDSLTSEVIGNVCTGNKNLFLISTAIFI